jgi:biotin synthase
MQAIKRQQMNVFYLKTVLNRVYAGDFPETVDIEYLLSLEDEEEISTLFNFADRVRKKFVGDGILLRGIIEFSNYCRRTCMYCGLNKSNQKLQRYRLDEKEILDAVNKIVAVGIKTVVLQSGEDDVLDAHWFKDVIEKIKLNFNVAVTLSVGERSYREYDLWKQAGADRYLLKIETADKELYNRLHPGMSFKNRVQCSKILKTLRYQNGSGCIVGLKGQTIQTLAKTIRFLLRYNFDMLSVGPFIPHQCTALGNEPVGDLGLSLKTIAVTRIVTKNAHIPANTAIGSLEKQDARIKALKAGANVIMPNFTPEAYKKLYEIYPGKRCVIETPEKAVLALESMAGAIGRSVDYSRGDSLKLLEGNCESVEKTTRKTEQ